MMYVADGFSFVHRVNLGRYCPSNEIISTTCSYYHTHCSANLSPKEQTTQIHPPLIFILPAPTPSRHHMQPPAPTPHLSIEHPSRSMPTNPMS